MGYFKWKKAYSIGIKVFNDDHKKLFEYINRLHDGLKAGYSVDEMRGLLDALLYYTEDHFLREEKLMLKYNYPGYAAHKKEHDTVLSEINAFYSDYTSGKKAFSFSLLVFLQQWIENHILKSDMQYKSFFTEISRKKRKHRENSVA